MSHDGGSDLCFVLARPQKYFAAAIVRARLHDTVLMTIKMLISNAYLLALYRIMKEKGERGNNLTQMFLSDST